MRGLVGIGTMGIKRRDEARNVDEQFARSRFAGKLMKGHKSTSVVRRILFTKRD